MQVAAKIMDSPVGTLKLLATDSALIAVLWSHEQPVHLRALKPTFPVELHPILQLAEQQLIAYFTGDRQQFTLPLAWVTGTDFQRAVWQALRRIPYGETCSYKALAEQINRPKAVRAVGAANGQNPLSIIVPCHRVIGVNGALVGFAGGVDKKQFLLELEQRQPSSS